MLLTGAWYLFLISLSSLLPAVLGSEFGFRRLYIKLLVDLFDWATGKGQTIFERPLESSDPRPIFDPSKTGLSRIIMKKVN